MNKKILIVDDESGVRQILNGSLSKLHFEVIEAEDGLQAVEMIHSELPDLVLLDIFMPKMDGFGVLGEVKVNQKNPIPIIVLTNYDEPKDIEKCKKLGAIDYMVKSNLTLKEIMTKIMSILG